MTILSCKRCGAIKVPGGWQAIPNLSVESDAMLEAHLDITLDRGIQRYVPDVEFEVTIENRLDRVLHLRLTVTGRAHPLLSPHEEQYAIEVRMDYGTCDTCGMMSGGYHDAILQVRADDRFLTEAEEIAIEELVTERTMNEYGKDEKAFVTQVTRTKYGLDFMMGSEHLCRQIADEIVSVYLADRKENYKLVGQHRGGKGKYRVTLLVRLPRYGVGDFVRVSGHPCQVLSLGKGGLACFDLVDRTTFTINPKSARWKTIGFLAEATERRKYMVISRSHGKSAQLMDATSFEMFELEDDMLDTTIEGGQTVFMFKVDEYLYLLPVSSESH
jgi:nonsense-mediated mRNA decay protein 3